MQQKLSECQQRQKRIEELEEALTRISSSVYHGLREISKLALTDCDDLKLEKALAVAQLEMEAIQVVIKKVYR